MSFWENCTEDAMRECLAYWRRFVPDMKDVIDLTSDNNTRIALDCTSVKDYCETKPWRVGQRTGSQDSKAAKGCTE